METGFLVGILNNITLLLALGFLYSVCARRWDTETVRGKVVAGILFGCVTVVGMLVPLQYAPGITFDGRTILLGIIGLFGGEISAAVAVLMTGTLRIWQGGVGQWAGLATIFSAACLGVLFRFLRVRYSWGKGLLFLYGFGVIVHLSMLLCMLILPEYLRWRVLSDIIVPILVVYPVATMLYGRLIIELEERNFASAALRESEIKYRQLFELESDALFLIDNQSGNILEANVAAVALYGYRLEELLAMRNVDLSAEPEETKKASAGAYSKSVVAIPLRYHRKKDGTVFPVEITAAPLLWKGRPAHIPAIRDITERKRAENALAESEIQLQTLVETIPDLIWLKNVEGVYLACNKMFENFFGAREADIVGKTDYDFVDKKMADFFREKDRMAMAAGKPSVNEEWLTFAKDGHRALVETIKTPMIDSEGTLIGVLGISRDITARVMREQEIWRDAQLAARVQNTLLPAPKTSEYIDITTVYKPFGYVGGDLYFLDWRYDDSLLRGFLVDATGHGLGTALHTASLHVLLREVNELDLPLADSMCWLNRRAGDYFDAATFAATLGFEIDLQTHQLRWVCAGIPKVWMATKQKTGNVASPGMFLGIIDDEKFETHTVSVDVGDSLYFMTDGLSDLMERFKELPLDRYSEMVGLLQELSESKDRRDDATAVCIHVRSLPQSLVRQDGWPRILRFNGYSDYQRFKAEVAKILAEVTGVPHSMHEVAVNEALANAMECRDGVPRQHKVRLSFKKIGNRLVVRVKTSRMGFAGNAVLQRLRSHPEDMFSFGEDAAMGRGIPMMLSMSHKMTYNSEGTEVLLAWKL